MAISMLKIRRPNGRLIFNMGIAIPGKTVFLIETAPWGRGDLVVALSSRSETERREIVNDLLLRVEAQVKTEPSLHRLG